MPLLGEDTANAITRLVTDRENYLTTAHRGGRPNSSKLSLHFSSVGSCIHVREKVSSCWRPDSQAFRSKIPCHARKSHSWQQRTPFCSTMRSMNRFDAALCVACLAPVQDTNFKTELNAIPPLLTPQGTGSYGKKTCGSTPCEVLPPAASRISLGASPLKIQHNVLNILWFATKISRPQHVNFLYR